MPAILVELGFLTNPQEGAFLKSKRGQAYMASAIFRAVRTFKEDYDQSRGSLPGTGVAGRLPVPVRAILHRTGPELQQAPYRLPNRAFFTRSDRRSRKERYDNAGLFASGL